MKKLSNTVPTLSMHLTFFFQNRQGIFPKPVWKRRRNINSEIVVTDMAKGALLVVDVQRDFCPGGSLAVPDGDEVVPVINKIIKTTEFDGGLFFSKDWHPFDHVSFATNHENRIAFEEIVLPDGMKQTLWPPHCVQGTSGAEFVDSLFVPINGPIIHKGKDKRYDSYSAFRDNVRASQTELQTLLKERQVQQLYICGLALDVCVLFSALDAIDLGFRPTIILDACVRSSIFPKAHHRRQSTIFSNLKFLIFSIIFRYCATVYSKKRGLSQASNEKAITKMENAGVEFITSDAIKTAL